MDADSVAMNLTSLERQCLDALGRSEGWEPSDRSSRESWTGLLLTVALEAAAVARSLRQAVLKEQIELKSDGTPVTRAEQQIETQIRRRVAAFDPRAAVLGEETGGELPASGIAVAIDPVDGTWALINRTETFAVTLAVYRDAKPWLGLVLSPTSGEVTYAARGERTRLLQLSTFGEPAIGCDLPLERAIEGGVLVNLHPASGNQDLVAALHRAWHDGELHMVRSPGGSPASALAEAAKGTFVYVNRWSRQPALPYDLAAGELLVRGAGGRVTDPDGHDVDLASHAGPFIAAVDDAARDRVAALVRRALAIPS
ncbi:MAG: inositol monophosphatase family protein [Acidobacteriota bacterium]